ncbi:hypothetical protein [Streptomyces murinus]|uniref:hypothetical protein n=1 Tax=Streptomyces murinus TaxID=33900 RepID=UPI003F48A150
MGIVLVARVLGDNGDAGCFPTEHHFASHVGALLDASSGRNTRQRSTWRKP